MKIPRFELKTEGVYEPREDSALLAEAVQEHSHGEILDMGTGSGIQALVASKKAQHVTAVDIKKETIETAKKNAYKKRVKNISFIQSDLFENVKGKFDLIIFNSPYLPSEDKIKGSEQWNGGKTGREVIKKFSEHLSDYLKENGKILLLISSLTGLEETKKIFKSKGFCVNIERKKKIPWETLYVLEIS